MKKNALVCGLVLGVLTMTACSNVAGENVSTESAEVSTIDADNTEDVAAGVTGNGAESNENSESVKDNESGDTASSEDANTESDSDTNTETNPDSGTEGDVENNSIDENGSEDDTDITTVENSDEDISDEDIETSPFFLWDYEGYIDEAKGYTWRKDFVNCDYDRDGKQDRVYRAFDTEASEAYYTIEFGNGRELKLPKAYDTGFPHVSMGDLDGDGEGEVLFSLSYDTGTDPMAFGEMWLFDYNDADGTYSEVTLPLASTEDGSKQLTLDYAAYADGAIDFKVQQTGYEASAEADDDYVEYWWTKDAITENRAVWYAKIKEAENGCFVACETQALPRFGAYIDFILRYDNGEYVIEDMSYTLTSMSE